MRAPAAALALVLAGCAGVAAPPAPAGAPDVRGTWRGTWGGAPLTLVVTDQTEGAAYAGLFVGPWLVSGSRYPGISGILSLSVRGAARSVRVDGWVLSARPLRLRLVAPALDGPVELTLTGDGDTLTGEGAAAVRWGPAGPVVLRRAG